MLSAEAYSFRQQARVAVSLSLVGGFTNAVAFVAAGNFVSHVTGNSTLVGIGAAAGAREVLFYAGMVGSFFLGAVTSAAMTETAKRRGARSKYVWPLTLEAALLVVLMAGLNAGWMGTQWSAAQAAPRAEWLFVAAYAMGLQNATITKISGAVVRSTHLTGVVTDLGIEGVHFGLQVWDRLRGRWDGARARRVVRTARRHPAARRVVLLGSIWASFVCGATLGAVLYGRFGGNALVAPAGFLVVIIWQSGRRLREKARRTGTKAGAVEQG
jgi:uncharacterized membrane protein YoaK (UPF0700 family)